MKRLIFVEPGRLDWEDTPKPVIQSPGEAIIRPTHMGRCDLDVLYVAGRMPLASGEPIGHEIIGQITDLGEDAAHHFKIGQTVIVPAQINCGTCKMCREGQTGRCETVPLGASYGMGRDGGYGGGVSEFVRVPFASAMLVPIPAEANHAEMMGLADMATDAWRAVGPQLETRPGASVLVLGGATRVIGIYAAGMAKAYRADRVVYVDPNSDNRAAAALYGVETASSLETVDRPIFDIVVDAGNDASILADAVRACGPAAFLTSVAPPFTSPELPLMEMYYKGLTYQLSRPNCRAGHCPSLEAWSSRGFEPGLVGPKIFDFDSAAEAWLDPALYVAVTR